MAWQDIVLTASIILMSYALIPQVIYGFKKKKKLISIQTSIVTTVAIFMMVVVFFSLGLYFSAFMDLLIGFLWVVLLIQGIVYK